MAVSGTQRRTTSGSSSPTLTLRSRRRALIAEPTRPEPMTWTLSITIRSSSEADAGHRGLYSCGPSRHALAMADRTRARVNLLGGFAAEVDGARVPDSAWRLRKAKDLVKRLALAEGHRLHREQAMDLLWPDRGLDSAGRSEERRVGKE